MSNADVKSIQRELCRLYNAPFFEAPGHLKLGIAENVRSGLQPINGLRHPPEGDASGWYVWAGEALPEDEDFFQPLHIDHLDEWHPGLQKYLGLAPGWRFLIDSNGHEDVWEDPTLLEVK